MPLFARHLLLLYVGVWFFWVFAKLFFDVFGQDIAVAEGGLQEAHLYEKRFFGCSYGDFCRLLSLEPGGLVSRPWTVVSHVFVMHYRAFWRNAVMLFYLGMWSALAARFFTYRFLALLAAASAVLGGLGFALLGFGRAAAVGPYAMIWSFITVVLLHRPDRNFFVLFRSVKALYIFVTLFLWLAIGLADAREDDLLCFLGVVVGGACLLVMRLLRWRRVVSHRGVGSSKGADKGLSDVDAILEKVSREGYHALTIHEKRCLADFSEELP